MQAWVLVYTEDLNEYNNPLHSIDSIRVFGTEEKVLAEVAKIIREHINHVTESSIKESILNALNDGIVYGALNYFNEWNVEVFMDVQIVEME